MPSFHSSFTYKNGNSRNKELIITSFETKSGNANSFLGMNSVYSENYDGTFRYDYGAKYKDVALISITLIRNDKEEMHLSQFRDIASWLTGARLSSWLDLYEVNERSEEYLSYSFLCKCINLQQYQLDGRIVGVTAEFESVSPWAFSPLQTVNESINGSKSINIDNLSDDLYSYVCPNIVFTNNQSNGSLVINNQEGNTSTTISGLNNGEVVTIKSNQIIYSSVSNKIFGDDFNFVWLKFLPGANHLTVSAHGTLNITYRYPIKVGDCLMEMNNNVICSNT